MKKIIVNINENIYEKLRIEAIIQNVDIATIIRERILHKPFDEEVEETFDDFLDDEIKKIFGEK